MVLLRAAREKAGLTQKELAKLANVPQQTISAIESRERKNPGAETLYRLSRALGVPMDSLYGEEAGQSDDPGICGAAGNVGRYEGSI